MTTTKSKRDATYRTLTIVATICLFLVAAPVAGAVASPTATPGSAPTALADSTSATENAPPDARTGHFRTYAQGVPVELDATDSSDPDGDALSYRWEQTDGPSVTLQDPNTATPMFLTPEVDSPTTFEFAVTVDDGTATDVATVVLEVEPGAEAPTARAGSLLFAAEGDPVELDGTQSHDPNNDPVIYRWEQTGGPSVSLTDADTATPTFEAPALAEDRTLTFELTVADDEGNVGTDMVEVEVDAGLEQPTADAGSDRRTQAGSSITLDGTDSYDPDGDPINYSWTQTAGPTVDLTGEKTANPSFTAPDVSEQRSLVFRLSVQDVDGYTEVDTVEVTVDPSDSGGGGGSGDAVRNIGASTVAPGGSVNVTLSTSFQDAESGVRIQDAYTGPVDSVELTSITLDGSSISAGKVVLTQSDAEGLSATLQDLPADANIAVTYRVTINRSAQDGDVLRFTGVDGGDVTSDEGEREFGTDEVTVSTGGGTDDGPAVRRVDAESVTPNSTLDVTLEAKIEEFQAALTLRDAVHGPVSGLSVEGITLNGSRIPTENYVFTVENPNSTEVILKSIPGNSTVRVDYTVDVNDTAVAGDRIRFVGREGNYDVAGRTLQAEFARDVVNVTEEVGVVERFDENGDGFIGDAELSAAIQAWVDRDLSDQGLNTAIASWVTGG